MGSKKDKPQGSTGPMSLGSGGAKWNVIQFPGPKDEREKLIADIFHTGWKQWVPMESEPSFAPFGKPLQNPENDLDFTIETAVGPKLMELTEFAPLKQHGPKFADAPLSLDSTEKAARALELVLEKSAHQGGADRFLIVYITEYAFKLDPMAIEIMRRALTKEPPAFDRVYYLSPMNLESAIVSEIYPGKPHHTFGSWSDEQLGAGNAFMPHPTEWVPVISKETTFDVGINGKLKLTAPFHFEVAGLPLKGGKKKS